MVDWRYHNYQLNGSYIDLGSFMECFHNVKQLLMYHKEMMAVLMGSTQHVQIHYNLLRCINQLIYQTKFKLHLEIPSGYIPGIRLPSRRKMKLELTELVAIH